MPADGAESATSVEDPERAGARPIPSTDSVEADRDRAGGAMAAPIDDTAAVALFKAPTPTVVDVDLRRIRRDVIRGGWRQNH